MAEKPRNVCVENEQCLYTDEVPTQVAGMTRLAVVTIVEKILNDGATIAARISTEKLQLVVPAGRCSPVDKMGQAGLCDETERSVLSRLETEDRGTDPVGPVGPYVTFDHVQPVGPYITRMGRIFRVIPISLWLMAQWARRLHSARWAQERRYPSVTLINV